ncbi:RNA polymerase sigma factor [Dyadobacter fermentans]|uniref:RNA polymerase, sigma-24 subunit, ECF subfamily n=1 Tax=Dyadobacter fermentans (strain ATCC 700827 / DSM 18053 / CIP 107007 / KCTC 52180 / NS114) TaxID=471854 RepID=C6VSP5_DYAFD|nr:sigma-70 family RNA polymerase sigma factor [Dyadobacter fermentans]ACT92867.1 RNA polymerase, sigma-24 subunit, ECF subfamily [Dyadobacter fermentans DSM 18053]
MHELGDLSDRQLLEMFQEGSVAAFEEIHRRYFRRLYAHAFKMLGNAEDAQDVVQEVFISLWAKGAGVRLHTGLAGYLFTSVRNRVLNLIEQKTVYQHHIDGLAAFLRENPAPAGDPDEEILFSLLEAEIENLPRKMKEVFELRRKGEMSYAEIADQLALSDHTVKKQISNAIKILRDRLVQWKSQLVVLFF